MDETTNDNVTVMKGGRTKESLRKAVEAELAEARIKEFRGKLKSLVIERDAAKKILQGKEDQINDLCEEYSDVIPG